MNDSQNPPILRDHRRQWRDFLYVYPVVARRSKGVSLGVNLNPDKRCSFACVYCQIDRRTAREHHELDLALLKRELLDAATEVHSGTLWQHERFAQTPLPLRRLNDIAFSGDGEPTLVPQFDRAVEIAASVRKELGLADLKLVVITNATQLDQPQVQRALPTLTANNGEIWAKLDAGTEDYYHRINHPYPRVTLDHILRNIAAVARQQPVVIQTLLLRLDDVPPSPAEIDAYCRNVGGIVRSGGKIKLIQLHTIARTPACSNATSLSDEELDAFAARIRSQLPEIPLETYYGVRLT